MKRRISLSILTVLVVAILIATPVLAAVLPTVSIQTPTNVATTTAVVNGLLIDPGGGTTNCTFIYGITTGVYTSIASITSNVTEGATFSSNLTGLTASTTYFVKAVAYNVSGNSTSSSEASFTTKGVISSPSSIFLISRTATSISVKWPGSVGASEYHLRYKTGTYSTNITLGTLAYEGPATSVTVSSLVPGTPYWWTLWSKDGGVYSSSYATELIATLAGEAVSTTSIGTSTPLRAFDAPSTARVAANPDQFPYSVYHWLLIRWSDISGEPPEATLWVILAIIVTLVFSIGAYVITRQPLAFLLVMLFGTFMGYDAWLFPGIAVAAMAVLVVSLGWASLSAGG
jgi:hypothetical protein